MEFDIGTILYVVITLVALIIGVLGKKKRPAGTGSPGGPAREPGGSFLESFERAFTMEQGEKTIFGQEGDEYEMPEPAITRDYREGYEIPYTAEPATGTESLLEEYERITGRQSYEGIVMEGERSTEPIEIVELEDEPGTDYFEIIKDFNAGTAIVYSAIINRIDY